MKYFLGVFLSTVLCSGLMAFTFDDDVPEAVKNQIVTDLGFMGGLAGSSTSVLHKEIFGDLTGTNYKNFFETRVTAVGMSDCGSPQAVACVIPFFDPSKIWLTQNYVKFSHPQVAKMMVVYHEARHTEVNKRNWPHATCPTPFVDKDGKEIKSIWTGATLAGQPACDVTPFGSYGSSMIMLKNIAKFCANCSEKVKMDSGIYADDQYKRVIDAAAKEQIRKDLYEVIAKL